MDITITLTAGSSANVGPFTIKITDSSNITREYSTGVSRASLAAGYVVLGVTTNDSSITAESTGSCTTTATVDISSVTGAGTPGYTLLGVYEKQYSNGCNSIGAFKPYVSSADYTKYLNNGSCLNNTGYNSSDIIMRSSNGNPWPETVYFLDGCGIRWKVTGGNLTYDSIQC
jgi:hypothetical protein